MVLLRKLFADRDVGLYWKHLADLDANQELVRGTTVGDCFATNEDTVLEIFVRFISASKNRCPDCQALVEACAVVNDEIHSPLYTAPYGILRPSEVLVATIAASSTLAT